MTTEKPAFSTRLNQFWAKMLAPINAYLGSALIIIALGMALVGLSGGHMGGHVDISVMRDGGDVSVRVQEGQMPEGVMREDMGKKGAEYHSGHHGYEHHGWHHGYGHHGGYAGGRGAGLFGLVLALGLVAMVGLVARLIQIEGHLAALRKGMENGPAAPAASAAPAPPAKKAKAKAKAKSPKAKQAKRRG